MSLENGVANAIPFFCLSLDFINLLKYYQMKKLFVALMFIIMTSFVFASTPVEYNIGKKTVKVFVKSIDNQTSIAVANVNLQSMEVQKLSSVATVKVVEFKNQIDVFGIYTTYNYCEHLYIAKKTKFVIHYDTDNIPIQFLCQTKMQTNTRSQLKIKDKRLFSSGGLPYIQC